MVKVVADARPRRATAPPRPVAFCWRGWSIDDGHGHVRGTAQIRRGLDRIASEARDPCRKRHSRCELNSASRRTRRRTGAVATQAAHAAPSASLLCFQRKTALASSQARRLIRSNGSAYARGALDRDAPLARRSDERSGTPPVLAGGAQILHGSAIHRCNTLALGSPHSLARRRAQDGPLTQPAASLDSRGRLRQGNLSWRQGSYSFHGADCSPPAGGRGCGVSAEPSRQRKELIG